MRISRRGDGLVLALYILLALSLTWPLILHFDTHIPGGVDGPSFAWNLWWVKYSIFGLESSPLSTDFLYYPLGVNLVANTSTFLNGIISLPPQFVFGTVVANNLIVYFSLVAGGYGAFLLAREILCRCHLKSDFAAALAGAFYAFGAWHINYVADGSVMLLSNEWIPFFALYLSRLDRGAWRNGALAGLFFVLNAWTELTFIPFVAMLTALYAIYVLFMNVARGQGGEETRRISMSPYLCGSLPVTVANLATLLAVAMVGVSPFALSLLGDTLRYGYFMTRGLGRLQYISPEPISFLVSNPQHPLFGQWASGISDPHTNYVFIGFAALLFAVLGFYINRHSREVRFWGATAIIFGVILLGPTLIVGGQATGIPLPFAAMQGLPFINANRLPSRFNVMFTLALAVLIAFGAARLRTAHSSITLGALCAVLAFEQLVLPLPLYDLRAPTIFQTIRAEPGDFTLLNLPLGWRSSIAIQGKMDYAAQYFQVIHQKRLIDGLASRSPQFKFQYYLELPVINSLIAAEMGSAIDDARREQDRAFAPQVLNFFDIRYIGVQRALTDPIVLAYVQDIFPVTEVYQDDERIIYRVTLPAASSQVVDQRDETARLYFDDGWGRVQISPEGFGYRWATTNDSRIWLPLTRADHKITFQLLAPRSAQKIQVRLNGQPFQELTVGDQWGNIELNVSAAMGRSGLNEFVFSTDTVPINATRQDNYEIGDTGVISPVDIAATGAGFDAGRFGEVFVAGKNVIESQRGYHLVAIHPKSGAVNRFAAFDTFADAAASTRLAQFVEQLPRGEIVAGVAIDDVSQKLQPEAIVALRQLGMEGDLQFQFRAGHAFIGVKGAQPGQALEQMDGRWPANVAVGKDVAGNRVAFALGTIRVELAGR